MVLEISVCLLLGSRMAVKNKRLRLDRHRLRKRRGKMKRRRRRRRHPWPCAALYSIVVRKKGLLP